MEMPQWSSGSAVSKFILKLNDGESHPGVLRGDITKFYQHWVNNKPVPCPGRESCELCTAGEKGSSRFRVNFITQVEGAWVARVLEGGKLIYDQLVILNKDCPLEKLKIRLTTNGKGQEKRTTVTPIPGADGIVSATFEKILAAVPLHDLSLEPVETPASEEAIPF